MKMKEICLGCGKPRVIQNKEYQLCRECNAKRLQCNGLHDIYSGKSIAEINQARKENDAEDMELIAPRVKTHVESSENGEFIIINETEDSASVLLTPEKAAPENSAWTKADYDNLGKKIAVMLFKCQKPVQKKTKLFKCPECSTPLKQGQPFCSNCGSEMEWEK